jgi:hypothetical protein
VSAAAPTRNCLDFGWRGRRLDFGGADLRWRDVSQTRRLERIDPADRPGVMSAIEDAIRIKGLFELEHQVRRANGGLGWALSGAIVPVPCGEETLDMIQHEAVVIRLGEAGSLLAEVSSLFGGCCDCSGQNNLSVGQMGSHPTH